MPAAVILAFAVTTGLVAIILMTRRLHARVTDDHDAGPQKFHVHPTPRIGGVPLFCGLIAATLALRGPTTFGFESTALILFCAVFAFAGGLAEDMTRHVGVRLRLLLTFASASLAFFFLDARISQLHLDGIDWALQFTLVSFAFTLFAVGGLAHAMNIIDGFNGLAGVIALIFLSAIAYVAHSVGDSAILLTSAVVAAAIAGFVVFNFPRGLIFLGDGGAYLVGFLIAELAVLLVHRNSEVSPWFALTLFSYPVVETFFSMYRKRVLRKQSAGEPDGVHLHMLIYKRLVRRFGGKQSNLWANSLTSPYLWLLAFVGALAAVLFWNHTGLLKIAMLIFTTLYIWLYWRIVRFRAPRFLVMRRLAASRANAQSGLDGEVIQER